MATAKKLPSGAYRCLIYIGDENGKRKYKSFTAKTKKEAEENQKMLSDILSKKYKIYSGGTQQGGGISPLWDGTFANLRDEHYIGFHTDIIEYSAELANSIGVRYGTRLIYGPFNYVNEEF